MSRLRAPGSRWIAAALLAAALAVPSPGEGSLRVVNHYTTRDGLPSDWIRDILVTGEGLWLATGDAGLCYLEDERVVDTYDRDGAGLPSNRFSSLALYRGKLYAGGVEGLVVFDGERWEALERIEKAVMKNVLLAVDTDKDRLWVEAVNVAGGLVTFDGEKWAFFGGGGKGLVNNVTAIAFQGETLWLGTRGSGIYRITGGEWEIIRAGQGLRGSSVSALRVDGPALWVGTPSAGLGRLRDGAWRWVTREDGLASNAVGAVEVFGGLVLAGTIAGLFVLEGEGLEVGEVALSPNAEPPRVTRIRGDADGETLWVGTTRGLYQLTVD
jgi:ligand-binding sensor domain-containing protein